MLSTRRESVQKQCLLRQKEAKWQRPETRDLFVELLRKE